MNRSNGASDSEVIMNTHNQFSYNTVRRTENKQSFVFQKMWAIIDATAKVMNIPKSQVSKSEALKLAYECWNTRTIEIAEELYLSEKVRGAKKVQKVICNPDTLKPNFIDTKEVEAKSVLYVEFNDEIYCYYFIDEQFNIGELTKSHFGFKQTAMFQTMKDRVTGYKEWETFFAKNCEMGIDFSSEMYYNV